MHIFILSGFKNSKVFLKHFYIVVFCSGRTFQRYLDSDGPPVVSDMASKNIFTSSNFWTDYSCIENVYYIPGIMNMNQKSKTAG